MGIFVFKIVGADRFKKPELSAVVNGICTNVVNGFTQPSARRARERYNNVTGHPVYEILYFSGCAPLRNSISSIRLERPAEFYAFAFK